MFTSTAGIGVTLRGPLSLRPDALHRRPPTAAPHPHTGSPTLRSQMFMLSINSRCPVRASHATAFVISSVPRSTSMHSALDEPPGRVMMGASADTVSSRMNGGLAGCAAAAPPAPLRVPAAPASEVAALMAEALRARPGRCTGAAGGASAPPPVLGVRIAPGAGMAAAVDALGARGLAVAAVCSLVCMASMQAK